MDLETSQNNPFNTGETERIISKLGFDIYTSKNNISNNTGEFEDTRSVNISISVHKLVINWG